MSDELSNATRIAALEEQVRQLTADLDTSKREHGWVNDLVAVITKDNNATFDGINAALDAAGITFLDEDTYAACIGRLAAKRDERNAYAERLLAENVRLSNDAAFMRSFINNEDVRSDFQTVTQMRQALDTERERCGVLAAEVLAWHAAEHLRKDEPHNEFMRLAEARARTRETHALDAAKFVGGAD